MPERTRLGRPDLPCSGRILDRSNSRPFSLPRTLSLPPEYTRQRAKMMGGVPELKSVHRRDSPPVSLPPEPQNRRVLDILLDMHGDPGT